MLQSSSHYLRPDYLAAPPPTLDNKSSPLALLAQTCSAIGADTTNPKLLAANIEKSTKSLKSAQSSEARDKSSPISSHSSSVSTGSVEQQPMNNTGNISGCVGGAGGGGGGGSSSSSCKATFKPYESNNNHIRERLDMSCSSELTATNLTNSQRSKTPKGNGSNQTNGQRCDSNQSASSQRESPAMAAAAASNGLRRTPSSQQMMAASAALDLQQRGISSSPQQQQQQQRVSSKESAAGGGGGGGGGGMPSASTIAAPSPSTNSRQQAVNDAAMAAAAKEASYVKALHAAAAAAAAGVPTTSAGGAVASPYYSSYPGATAGGMPYPMDLMAASALMSPHHPMFKAAAMNPYLNYARLKGLDASTAAAMMSPNVCRDPYCTGCPSSPHYLNKAAGQPCPAGCPQCEVASGKANGAMGANASGSNSAAAAAAAAASSYHAQLAALAAASQLPYVCSWIGSDAAYCGKRFGTSDELFQHLRTHTASVPDSVLSAAAAGGIPPNHPLFQRTYPTPPLSPLSAARYHPYGKPSMLPPSLAPPGLPGLPPHPALAQYFSPYSLYGPRMGSSHP